MNNNPIQQRDREMTKNFETTTANIMMYFEGAGQEKKDILDKLRNIISDYGKEMSTMAQHEEIRKKFLQSHHKNKEDIQDTVRKFKEALNVIDPSADPSVKKRLHQFDELINTLSEGDQSNANDDSDEELTIKGTAMNVIDPVSKKVIVDPVKNTICGHTYDRESITGLLSINPRTRCPVMGCNATAFISLSNLQENNIMKLYLEKYHKNSKHQLK